MFRGDHPDLRRVVHSAMVTARDFGHPRTGSEHVLLALTAAGGAVAAVLGRHGATEAVVQEAVRHAAPLGAGAAADRESLVPLGIDVDGFFSRLRPATLDRPTKPEPLLPFGAAKARRRCARLNPPLGLDVQATYEASLRLALARRDREHRPEHLALSLVALDPGAAWVLSGAGADTRALLADLAIAYPPPRRNLLLRAERRVGQRSRRRDLIRRYERTTGRTVTSADTVAVLITS
ncbi:Clp protease N-terminal domain-containing protein [Rugosimonospora acidiphila]|uniref:Clp protease N-terminal domain-containing protein n=1 Tax=Rugosimonospora acidiphila TaxID=556531 RepID=A0ABP9RMU1_9ACTN